MVVVGSAPQRGVATPSPAFAGHGRGFGRQHQPDRVQLGAGVSRDRLNSRRPFELYPRRSSSATSARPSPSIFGGSTSTPDTHWTTRGRGAGGSDARRLRRRPIPSSWAAAPKLAYLKEAGGGSVPKNEHPPPPPTRTQEGHLRHGDRDRTKGGGFELFEMVLQPDRAAASRHPPF